LSWGASPGRPPLRVLLAVGIVAACTLALQVLLTRLFAATVFYHFGFLAISLALLGTGGGAIAVYLWPERFERPSLERAMARWCAAFAVLLMAVPLVLVRIDWGLQETVTAPFAAKLALACVLSTALFTAGGLVIALAIRGYVAHAGRVYAFDLAGAGIGSLAIVPLLWLAPAPELIVGLGVLCGLGAFLLAGPGRPEARTGAVLAGVGVALLVIAGLTSLYQVDTHEFGDRLEPVSERWSPISRVVAYERPGSIFYDRDYATVPDHRRGQPYHDWRDLQLGPQSIGYELTDGRDALVIGGGGGRDIHNALSSGQRRVDVIELNANIRRAVDEDLREQSGAPYSFPRVHTEIGDGRSTLAARDRRYDQIHIGFTNTLSPNGAQAYALTENNLYTLEAVDEYFEHLKPGGVLNLSRMYRFSGEEALRATVLVLAALEERGIERPERHVIVMRGTGSLDDQFGTILTRLEPYTPAELERARRLAQERGGRIVYMSGGPFSGEWAGLARASSLDAFCEGYRYDVCPPTDNRPFFFNMARLSSLGREFAPGSFTAVEPFRILLVTLGILAVLCVLALVTPLVVLRRRAHPPSSSLLFFAAIGLGFLALEVVLIQRLVLFLGFPTYALSVVLFSLLLFTGAGAALSERWTEPRRALTIALGAALGLVALAAFGLQPLLRALIDLPFAARIAIAVMLLAPIGLALGTAMPIGLKRLSALHPSGVAWAWGVNGVTSVLGAALATVVAVLFGFTVVTLLAFCCYLAALVHVRAGRWPERAEAGARGYDPSRGSGARPARARASRGRSPAGS
jgi:hypothetical protein